MDRVGGWISALRWRRAAPNGRNRRSASFIVMLTGALLSLSACQTPPQSDIYAATPDQWRGRFSVTLLGSTPDDNLETREDRAQGRFSLRRSQQQIVLDLFSPFGQTLATAKSDRSGATLITAKGQKYAAPDADGLIQQALGFRLPVTALPNWLEGSGLAQDNQPVERQGWQVTVEKRFNNGKPRRLSARWPAQQRVNQRRINLLVLVDGAKK